MCFVYYELGLSQIAIQDCTNALWHSQLTCFFSSTFRYTAKMREKISSKSSLAVFSISDGCVYFPEIWSLIRILIEAICLASWNHPQVGLCVFLNTAILVLHKLKSEIFVDQPFFQLPSSCTCSVSMYCMSPALWLWAQEFLTYCSSPSDRTRLLPTY